MKGVNERFKLKFLFLTAVLIVGAVLGNAPSINHVHAQSIDILHVTFIDVGQGDSALLRTDSGTTILIDAGRRAAGETVVAFLEAEGITSLDVVVMSHNHADHIGGLVDVFESSIEVGLVLFNGNECITLICLAVWEGMSARGIVPTAVQFGDSFIWDAITVDILNPQPISTGDENEDSIVMTTGFYDYSLLFTGDIGFETEDTLIAHGLLGKQNILKVAHHGSAGSTSTAFLDLVNPDDAVISVGDNNPYGHPSPATLSRLVDSGANIFRTDLDGNVSFSFVGEIDDSPSTTQTYLPLIFTSADSIIEPPIPDDLPGENVQCHLDGPVELCASVSNANPPRFSTVTVYGRLMINGEPQPGKPMSTTWYYKTTSPSCDSGITDGDGLASCARSIGGASAGYQVNIAVVIEGHSVTTSFTPREP